MILAAGLSPAWQQLLVFDALRLGEVTRAREVHWCASGKVLNVARALHGLGAQARALTVIGGHAGEEIRADFQKRGISARWIEVASPTRVCTTLLVKGQPSSTELVPNAAAASEPERRAFREAYLAEAVAAGAVVLIGSLPGGTPPDFYCDLIEKTACPVVLDARGPEMLEALAARPFLVKPNRQELARTLGRDLADEPSLMAALQEVQARGATWVVATDGPRPTYAHGGGRGYRFRGPAVPVLNPIGCGDCMAAGIALALSQRQDAVDAIRYGIAVAAAKAGQLLPGDVDAASVPKLLAQVEVTALG